MTDSKPKLLCPIDFSDGAQTAVNEAASLAKLLGAEVELFHAFEVPMLTLPDGGWMVGPEVIESLTQRCLKLLDDKAAELRDQGVAVTTRLEQGPPAECIETRAQSVGAIMIVMGTHGYRGLKHALLGSVAERVVRSSTVPVLTVRVPKND